MILWRQEGQPTPVFLPGESHEQRTLAGHSPWGCKESDMTEQLTLHYYILKQIPDSMSLHPWFCSLKRNTIHFFKVMGVDEGWFQETESHFSSWETDLLAVGALMLCEQSRMTDAYAGENCHCHDHCWRICPKSWEESHSSLLTFGSLVFHHSCYRCFRNWHLKTTWVHWVSSTVSWAW